MDEAFTHEELKLAFAFHVVGQILGADGQVERGERTFLERTFPRALLERSRFLGPDGQYTARWNEALGEALLVLPTLPVGERIALVDVLFRAALADDVLELEEGAVVERAARLLALSPADLAALAPTES